MKYDTSILQGVFSIKRLLKLVLVGIITIISMLLIQDWTHAMKGTSIGDNICGVLGIMCSDDYKQRMALKDILEDDYTFVYDSSETSISNQTFLLIKNKEEGCLYNLYWDKDKEVYHKDKVLSKGEHLGCGQGG